MIKRILQLAELTSKKSAFLLGPRSTGKSYWINKQLGECTIIDLLLSSNRRRYLSNPGLLQEVAAAHKEQLIVIDEIQLIPELLDEVHSCIEKYGCRFLLTGSSARKLKKAGANMLGGRARSSSFHPFTWKELSDAGTFDLEKYILFGGLPRVYLSEEPQEELIDYVDTYLNEEIKAESVARDINGFENFFYRSAMSSGEVLNFTKVASDAQISPTTVRSYYEVLEDTLIGFYLTPWKGSNRKAIQSAKFYLFDVGVRNFMLELDSISEKSDLYGHAFEHFVVQEIKAMISYRRLRKKLYFWRTTHKDEVDLIIGDDFAIEIKATNKTEKKHLKGLVKIEDEGFKGRRVLLSKDKIRRNVDGIELWYWEDFFKEIWCLEF